MTDSDRNIDDLDLLAYADGLLDGDPTHKAAVEAFLAERPEEAERIAIYARQNDEIRRRYDFKLAEAPPQRLRAALTARREAKRAGAARIAARIAAMVALLLATGASGWVLGAFQGRDKDVATGAFVEMAVAEYRAAVDGVDPNGPVAVAAGTVTASPARIPRQVEITLPAPDLSAQGYRLIDEAVVATRQRRRAVRYLYESQNGEHVGLFMRPHAQERTPAVRLDEVDGTHVASWSDGPIRYGLVADRDVAALSEIAAQMIDVHREAPNKPADLTLRTAPRTAPADALPARSEPAVGNTEPPFDGAAQTSTEPLLVPATQPPSVPIVNPISP